MSALHSPRAPWLMLLAFILCAMTFFSLAVGRDVGLVAALFDPQSEVTLKEEIQRLVSRWGGQEGVVEQDVGALLPNDGPTTASGAEAVPVFRAPIQQPPAPEPSPGSPDAPGPPSPSPQPDGPGNVLNHSFSQVEGGFEAIFQADRPIPRPNVFFIGAPARWVVDIPGDWRNMARFNNNIADGFIRQVVLGEHDDYLRIVFHYRNRELLRPAQPPALSRQDNSLAVTLTPPNDN
ncbi:AMIN domain-containing protein [Desulfonatronum thioautotrophicum]|uniref:AMIN domain-containing protein n=1 Tax=Desulfonatronum thioautotrophicum TaxID=617001 RepID=UPI0005EB6252|nr:AMIN domain-containing protein [Desulfonatronum thioautotrophicum]